MRTKTAMLGFAALAVISTLFVITKSKIYQTANLRGQLFPQFVDVVPGGTAPRIPGDVATVSQLEELQQRLRDGLRDLTSKMEVSQEKLDGNLQRLQQFGGDGGKKVSGDAAAAIQEVSELKKDLAAQNDAIAGLRQGMGELESLIKRVTPLVDTLGPGADLLNTLVALQDSVQEQKLSMQQLQQDFEAHTNAQKPEEVTADSKNPEGKTRYTPEERTRIKEKLRKGRGNVSRGEDSAIQEVEKNRREEEVAEAYAPVFNLNAFKPGGGFGVELEGEGSTSENFNPDVVVDVPGLGAFKMGGGFGQMEDRAEEEETLFLGKFKQGGGFGVQSDSKTDSNEILEPVGEQPRLVHSRRALMQCDGIKQGEGADSIENIAYWRNVPQDEGVEPKHRAPGPEKYLTFEADTSGWNNQRLGFECALALAMAMGRTLVLNKENNEVFNLAAKDGETGPRSFGDFYDLDEINDSRRVKIITLKEFLDLEESELGIAAPLEFNQMTHWHWNNYFRDVGAKFAPAGIIDQEFTKKGFVFPYEAGEKVDLEDPRYASNKQLEEFLIGRTPLEYTDEMKKAKIIHIQARMLLQFYAFIKHADIQDDNYMKRTMRDLLHYRDEIYCKASQILTLVKEDAKKLGSEDGSFHAFHIRRGDFLQAYVAGVMSAEELYQASKDWLTDGAIVYVATDERDKSFFDDLKKRYKLLFLSDYWDRITDGEINPKYMGIVDTVVASYGVTFGGSWWSTFSAYILRLRGYHGFSKDSNWYFFAQYRTHPHTETRPVSSYWYTEWSAGWEGIDSE